MKKNELAQKIAFVPQMFSMNYAFTVKEVIMMGRYPHTGHLTSPTEKDYAIVNQVIIDTNLTELENCFVNALSGGELQRVIIARAIAQDTSIILLDEPISHLDIHYQYEIITLLKKMCRKHKKTIISVLHDLNVTMNHCDHIFLLKDGHIIEQGEPLEVLTPEAIHNIYGVNVEMIRNASQKWMTW
jgi:iron complex transport system ATP-binding protein